MSVARDRLVHLKPMGQCALLALVVGVALVIVTPLGFWLGGVRSIGAAAAAAGVVWIASALATIVADLVRRPADVLTSFLLGMLIRMSLPLAACVIVYLKGGELFAGGFVYFVLAFYLIVL